jgi:hypothetical protein
LILVDCLEQTVGSLLASDGPRSSSLPTVPCRLFLVGHLGFLLYPNRPLMDFDLPQVSLPRSIAGRIFGVALRSLNSLPPTLCALMSRIGSRHRALRKWWFWILRRHQMSMT